MSEWKEYKLSDIVLSANTGLDAIRRAPIVEEETGIKCLRIQDISQKKPFIKWGNSKVTSKDFERAQLLKDDIIMARTCSPGIVFKAKENLQAVFNNGLAKIRPNRNLTTADYLFYLFKSSDFIGHIYGISDGTSVQLNMKLGDLLSYKLNLPPIPEQTPIASVLGSLDDKIDLLHRQNATLEKMAETLFRQWFVEEAKEEWEMGRISDYAIHFKESIQPQKNRSTLYAHYSIPSYDNGKNPVKELGGEIQSNKYKIPNYCILFSKLNPHKDKRVWILQDEVESNGICSTEFQVVLPKKRQHLYFLYGWLTLNENYNEIASGVGGTSGSHQRIDPNTIYEFQCPLLTDDTFERYNIRIEPIFKKQVINQTQIRTLTALRDTLLPKLMSGEVKVEMN